MSTQSKVARSQLPKEDSLVGVQGHDRKQNAGVNKNKKVGSCDKSSKGKVGKPFVNALRANAKLRFGSDAEYEGFKEYCGSNLEHIIKEEFSVAKPKRGYFVEDGKWVIAPKERLPPTTSDHKIVGIHGGYVQVPAAIIDAPVAAYRYKNLDAIQEKQLTEYLGLTKDESADFYAIANFFEDVYPGEDGIQYALMIYMLPLMVPMNQENFKVLIATWPLNKQATMDYFNLSKMILHKMVHKLPIGLHVMHYHNYMKNGFVIGNKSNHNYRPRVSKPTLADKIDQEVPHLVASQPRLRAAMAGQFDELMETQPIHESFILEFDGDVPLEASADAFYNRSGIKVHGMSKSKAINIVRRWNKEQAAKITQSAIDVVNQSLTAQLKSQVSIKTNRPLGIKRGSCSTDSRQVRLDLSGDGQKPQNDLMRQIFDTNASKKSTPAEVKIAMIYTNSAHQQQPDYVSKKFKSLTKMPPQIAAMSEWYDGNPLALVAKAIKGAFPRLDKDEYALFNAGRVLFKPGPPMIPNNMINEAVYNQTIRLNVPSLDPFLEMIDATRNDEIMVHGIDLVEKLENHTVVDVHLTVPNIYTEHLTPAPFLPQYMSRSFLVDELIKPCLSKNLDFAKEFIGVVEKYRLCAGNPIGQLVRYGKEVTVNKNIVPPDAQITPTMTFRAPKFLLDKLDLEFFKNVWSMMELVNTDKASAGILYGDGKKGMKTTIADLCILSQLFERDFEYVDWMGAHQMKPKYEITNMDKFWTKTRSIFVGNSFIQVLLSPLYTGLYDYGYDYDNPLIVVAQVCARKSCLNITQQKFIECIRKLTQEDKDKLCGLFGEEILFAYSDNVYYYNIRDGTFISGDGVAMESQVKTDHVELMFNILEVLYNYGKETPIAWDIEPGVVANPYYEPSDVDMRYNPPHFFGDSFDYFCQVFSYVPEFKFITKGDGKVYLDWEYGDVDPVLTKIRQFMVKCFNGTVVLGDYQAPLGFLPSGWYTTSLLNTLVSLGYIWSIEQRAIKENKTKREVFLDPAGTPGYNFTIENDPKTNVYGDGVQMLDFLGFNLKDGCVVLRDSGLYPSVTYYQRYNRSMPQFRKSAIHIATWISALFNGAITSKEMRAMFEYELQVRSTNNIADIFLPDFDPGLVEAIGVNTSLKFSLEQIYERAAKMCGMKDIPKPTRDCTFRFQEFQISSEYNFGDNKHMAIPTAVQLFLNGRHPYHPQVVLQPEKYHMGLAFIIMLLEDVETYPVEFIKDLIWQRRNFKFDGTPEDTYQDAYACLVNGSINWEAAIRRKENHSKKSKVNMGSDAPGSNEGDDPRSHGGVGGQPDGRESPESNGGEGIRPDSSSTGEVSATKKNDKKKESTPSDAQVKKNKGKKRRRGKKIVQETPERNTVEHFREVAEQLGLDSSED